MLTLIGHFILHAPHVVNAAQLVHGHHGHHASLGTLFCTLTGCIRTP